MDTFQIPTDALIASPSDTAGVHGIGVLYYGGACAVVTQAGNTVVLPAVLAGAVIPLMITKVLLTGTGATDILVFR